MATLAEIRTAIKTVIEGSTTGLKVYPLIPGTATGRCVVVRPVNADFAVTMGRGSDTWALDLQVLVPGSDLDVAQTHLDGYIDGGGANSLRALIFANRTLGLANTDAYISGLAGYGSFEAAGYQHVGAVLRLSVQTRPS